MSHWPSICREAEPAPGLYSSILRCVPHCRVNSGASPSAADAGSMFSYSNIVYWLYHLGGRSYTISYVTA